MTDPRETKQLTIDDFIEIVAPKIKHQVITVPETITGSELMLTGAKLPKDEKIDPNRVYEMQVPAVVQQNHKQKLSLAWLRAGRKGIRAYLYKWLDADVLEKVMSVCPEAKFLVR
jgi:hypothetical protein